MILEMERLALNPAGIKTLGFRVEDCGASSVLAHGSSTLGLGVSGSRVASRLLPFQTAGTQLTKVITGGITLVLETSKAFHARWIER